MPIGRRHHSRQNCAATDGFLHIYASRATALQLACLVAAAACLVPQVTARTSTDWSFDGPLDDQDIFIARGHHLKGSNGGFVVLDGAEQQRYRLLGILPILSTATTQLAILLTTVAACVIGAIFTTRARRRRRADGRIDWLGVLPEPLVRLVFFVQWEVQGAIAAGVEDIMSLITTPVGIGRSLAAKIAGRGSSAQYSDAQCDGPSNNGGGRRRWLGRTRRQGENAVASGSNEAYYSGLYNTGNSCFLNSTLQNLAAVHGIEDFLENIIAQAEAWDVPTPVADALYDIITELNTPTQKRSAFIPRQLTDALSAMPQTRVGSFFYAHQQQDAHELLVLVTGALDDELNGIAAERDKVTRAQNVGLCAAIAPSLSRDTRSIKQAITNPFRSLVAQRTACLDCGYVEAVRHYPTDELSLSVPGRAGSAITLEACLSNWSKIEVVDWICFHCSLVRTLNRLRSEASYLASTGGALNASEERQTAASPSAKKKSGAKRRKHREVKVKEEIVTSIITSRFSEDEVDEAGILNQHDIKLDRTFSRGATKQVMIARTPQVLVMHINRSSYSASNFGASKNNAMVIFDEQLDIAPIVTGGDLSVSGDTPISRGATPMRENGVSFGSDGYAQVRGHSAQTNGKQANTSNGNGSHNEELYDTEVKTKFRLCGIVVHYGGHSSGHYVAFRRRKGRTIPTTDGIEDLRSSHALPDEWYRISDDSVTRCSLRDVLHQNPFILFYERMRDEHDTRRDSARLINHAPISRHASGMSNGHMASSLADTARLNAAYGAASSQASRSGTNQDQDEHLSPAGFEHFFKTPQERVRSLHRPRIVERWASTVSTDASGSLNGTSPAPPDERTTAQTEASDVTSHNDTAFANGAGEPKGRNGHL